MDTQFLPHDISVVITTYNRREQVAALVAALPEEAEIIVADDGTLPTLAGVLPRRVKLYSHEHDGARPSTCRNEGAKLATRPKIVFLDDDVYPHSMCLVAHSVALNMYTISFGLLPRERFVPDTDDRTTFFISDMEVLWNFGWSANMGIRTETFFELGGFDAETFNGGHGFEDIDFARRASMIGKSMHLNRLSLAHHPSPHTSATPNEAVLRNQSRYEEKWGEA